MQPEHDRLHRAISSWRQWSGKLRSRPTIVAPLAGGRSNRSYLLDSDGARMVLRLNAAETPLPGINRGQESAIWHAASARGIAPALLHTDTQAGFLVSAFIENQMQHTSRAREILPSGVFSLLERCHSLEVEAAHIDYQQQVEHYWQIIETRGRIEKPELSGQRAPMQSNLEALINGSTSSGLCHHDPLKANVIGNPKKLYLIDWEYAARGLVIMDYAALAIEWEIEDTVVTARTGVDKDLLTIAKAHYRYLCALWEEVVRLV